MQPSVVYWKKLNSNEQGYDLIEIFEDGNVVKRSFVQRKDGFHVYEETAKDGFKPNGKIRIDKVSFSKDGSLNKNEVLKKSKTVETYKLSEWEAARQKVRALQKSVTDDITTDYHSILALDEDSVNISLPTPTNRHDYPIVKLRAINYAQNFKRKVNAERLEKVFIPKLNEVIYFHHLPKQHYVNATADNIFALDTRIANDNFTEEDFFAYINEYVQKINKKLTHYRTLINIQREQRAMHEAEEIGDLFPR